MFESLFQDRRTIARHRHAPLAKSRERFLAQCAERGMKHTNLCIAAGYLLKVIEYLRLSNRPSEPIPLAKVRAAATRWANRRQPHLIIQHKHLSRRRFVRVAKGWLQSMDCLKLPPPIPHAHVEQVAAFLESQQERGFSSQTLGNRRRVVQNFLDRLCRDKTPLKSVTPDRIDRLVSRKAYGDVTRGSIRTYLGHWRAFLQYAEKRDWCRAGVAASIMVPRVYAQETIPAGPSRNDVSRLLASTEGDRPMDIRDRAILMLLIVYGIRASEVCQLRLDDLDWEQEQIQIRRPKVLRRQLFPLSRTVGDTIVRYLKEVRPKTSHRELFLSLNGSERPLRPARIWGVVALRLRSLGVTLPHYGPHALRHTCATHLLEQGHTLKEIGDYLGHSRQSTTCIYAKVDLKSLRKVADVDLGVLL